MKIVAYVPCNKGNNDDKNNNNNYNNNNNNDNNSNNNSEEINQTYKSFKMIIGELVIMNIQLIDNFNTVCIGNGFGFWLIM